MDGKDRFLMCFFLFMYLYGGFKFFLNEVIYAFTFLVQGRGKVLQGRGKVLFTS